MNDNKKCGVYAILSAADSKVYIGGCSNLKKRKWQHFYDLKRGRHNKRFQSAYNELGESNFTFHIIYECKEEDLLKWEQFFIDFYKSYDPESGYNYQRKAKKPSTESNKKRSFTLTGSNNPFYGKTHSEETKKKIASASRGRIFTEETRRKIGRTHLGKNYVSTEKRRLWRAKTIAQYDKQGNLIKTYFSASEAGRVLNIQNKDISACAIGRQKSAHGYIWEYINNK